MSPTYVLCFKVKQWNLDSNSSKGTKDLGTARMERLLYWHLFLWRFILLERNLIFIYVRFLLDITTNIFYVSLLKNLTIKYHKKTIKPLFFFSPKQKQLNLFYPCQAGKDEAGREHSFPGGHDSPSHLHDVRQIFRDYLRQLVRRGVCFTSGFPHYPVFCPIFLPEKFPHLPPLIPFSFPRRLTYVFFCFYLPVSTDIFPLFFPYVLPCVLFHILPGIFTHIFRLTFHEFFRRVLLPIFSHLFRIFIYSLRFCSSLKTD